LVRYMGTEKDIENLNGQKLGRKEACSGKGDLNSLGIQRLAEYRGTKVWSLLYSTFQNQCNTLYIAEGP
jgi:hypothetical protein